MHSPSLQVIVKGIEYVAAAILAVATLNVFFGGIFRYLFNVGIPDSNDFGKMMLGVVTFLGIGAIGIRGGHIVVSALIDILPLGLQRLALLLASLITCGSMGVLAWTLLSKALQARDENLISFDLGVPLWGFYLAAGLGLTLGTLAFFYAIVFRRRIAAHPVGDTDAKEGVTL